MNIHAGEDTLMLQILLADQAVLGLVIDTPQYREHGGSITSEVMFNGIKTDGAILEKTLRNWITIVEKHVRTKYNAANIDRLVEQRAEALLGKHVDNALENLHSLASKLQNFDDVLVPHWSRNKVDN